jgi:SatD family (SatD)
MPPPPASTLITLIGDVIDSKSHPDRGRLQHDIQTAAKLANSWVEPAQPVHATVGDEFQGVYRSLGEAALASMLMRLYFLSLESGVDTRYGLGMGDFSVFSQAGPAVSQDGPGWWAARAAIQHVHEAETRTRSASPHTWINRWGDEDQTPETAVANSFFMTRDALIDRMNPRQCRLLLGLALGRTNAEVAASEHISPSAVSQTLRSSEAYALLDSHRMLLGADG